MQRKTVFFRQSGVEIQKKVEKISKNALQRVKMCYIYNDDLDCQVFGIYMTDLEKSAGRE